MSTTTSSIQWIPFPDERLPVFGLPWLGETAPRLWRLPPRAVGSVPRAVDRLMRLPTGGRIRFRSDTGFLGVRVSTEHLATRQSMSALGMGGMDAYVNDTYWSSQAPSESGECELTFFSGVPQVGREIAVYLPACQDLRVVAVGIDGSARLQPPRSFAGRAPLVFYGSSIAQGACAGRPGMSYEAIVARAMGLDFVNLGFGGAGKAEEAVVELVAELAACCFVFDLGKSYGTQSARAYVRMLETVRAAHPTTPIVCMTPIFSTREFYDVGYQDISRHVRAVVAEAVAERLRAGDATLHVIGGLELLGEADADAFQEGVHPNDLGFKTIADRLEPTLRAVLQWPPSGRPQP